MRSLRLLLVLVAVLLPSVLAAQVTEEAEENAVPNPYVPIANQVLAQAGLPALPGQSVEMECYAWSGLSAGIYAFFKLEKEAFESYLAPYSRMERINPISASLLVPPNAAAPWFSPGSLTNGTVFFRGRITRAAPETFRLYVDPENFKIFLYYTWNNKRTYP